ncbi:hypothetical protein VNO78_06439 [Psophocarpus tetragonolobus]|uniref:Uncharacterized protein n=1 Tax=Psophocarpus tetragonolobus TaxID=3891 RepID=A0AAN9ST80_PSOTE
MATRTLLKLKQNLNPPLRFFRTPTFTMTRPVSPITRPESPSPRPSTLSSQSMFARQVSTAGSPRGASRKNKDEDDDFDVSEEDDGEFDHLDEEFDDSDVEDFSDEDENPKGKTKASPRKW